MPRWPRLWKPKCFFSLQVSRRWISTPTQVERVSVPCASSGSITLSLRNISAHPTATPLVIYLPPCSRGADESEASIPSFLNAHPTAVINYRWPEFLSGQTFAHVQRAVDGEQQFSGPLHWPTPIHDILFGYEWIVDNLAPPEQQRRDIYVFGSFFGASLAAALALTETHPHQRMAVRRLIAYNGIYNWTTFLPDHPVNQAKVLDLPALTRTEVGGTTFHYMKQQIPGLFKSPSNLFDPFASPCLFFHTAGMLTPSDFSHSALPSPLVNAIDALSLEASTAEDHAIDASLKVPWKGYLTFPPRQSTLRIPEALFLHDTPAPYATRNKVRGKLPARKQTGENSFATQADELVALMRRSINKLEMKERMQWDHEFDVWETEAESRVQVASTGPSKVGFSMDGRGQQLVSSWLAGVMESG